MINTNSLGILGQFYFNIKESFKSIYQNSNFYEKKISKTFDNRFEYKPSPHLLSSIIKYQNKKYKIEDFAIESIWQNNLSSKDYEKLNNFFWFFSLDLKSSKKTTQTVIKNWISNNKKFQKKSWEFDLTAKRIISWLSNHQLTYEDGDQEYRSAFDHMIQKQTNHLLNEIKNSKEVENKMIGCAAIILTGLAYKNEKQYLVNGLNLLKNIIKSSIDNQGFPKSRNIRQLIFYLKYFIIIREWFKESQSLIPEYIDETIYYLGSSYAFIWQNIKQDIFFNGNYSSENKEFDQYLKRFGYTFKNQINELGGYAILKNKKIILAVDIGSSPNKTFSNNYQAGALSFEIFSNEKKLISNAGYYADRNNKFNKLSRSTSLHCALTIEDYSSCNFIKHQQNLITGTGLKISKKNVVFENNYWKISGTHDGYLIKFGTIYEREIEFYPEQMKFIGYDKLFRKSSNKEIKFDIRFHLDPNSKVMKTQDNKSILIELDEEGWKFSCDNFDINIDNGLYFGNKNSYKENQNIFISGINNKKEQIIKWEISKL
ncbi:heparinase II/III family protein [Candidatus Pelagibacter communis]|uniref:heparinase II/III family protein n=1 Tax=Pelagibacter ubique TaxID=198252 RepID=UPI00092D0646|nr:heparinase II/III family protein [Candidatus Pelagibacter ubique]